MRIYVLVEPIVIRLSFKLKDDRFRLETFYHKCGKTLEQVTPDAADAPSPKTFKVRLDGGLNDLI